MDSKYHVTGRCKFSLKYHVIFVVKYRKPLLLSVGESLKRFLLKLENKLYFMCRQGGLSLSHLSYILSVAQFGSVPDLDSGCRRFESYTFHMFSGDCMKSRKTNKAKKISNSCKNNGSCPWCSGNRTFSNKKRLPAEDVGPRVQ